MRTAVRQRLDRFKELCLDPLPDEVLLDTHLNALLRQARRPAWRRQHAILAVANAERELSYARDLYRKYVEGINEPWRGHAPVDKVRRATADLILTPAPDTIAVAWKRQAAKKAHLLPISVEEVEKAIADDEAWLAAHPDKRPRKG